MLVHSAASNRSPESETPGDKNAQIPPPREEAVDPESGLTRKELRKADEFAAARAHIIHEVVRKEGNEELNRSAWGLAWSGLAAGLSMGFSLVAEGLLRSSLPDTNWRPLVAKLGYSVGFVVVILGKQQLYTEDTLTPVVPFMSNPSWRALGQVFRLWVIVLLTNLLGALLFAWVCGNTEIFDPQVKKTFLQLGQEAMGKNFALTFLKGIFGGWLIALIGWILGGFRGDGVSIVVALSYLVGLGRFSHIIAGSVETFYLVVTGAASWADYISQFMLPTVLGNTLGGVAMVALVNHAQSVAGRVGHHRR